MARTLSAEAFRAMFAQETDAVFLMCITIEHASLPQALRFVYNNAAINRTVPVYGAVTFSPALFQVNLPEEAPDKLPQVEITADNVDMILSDAIRSLTGRAKMTLEVVLASQPDVVEAGPFEFYLLSCSYNANTISGTLGFEDDILNTAFPKDIYTPQNSSGLF